MSRIQIFRIEHKSGIGPFNISKRIADKLMSNLDCRSFMLCMEKMPTVNHDCDISPVWNDISSKSNIAIRFGASKQVFKELFIQAYYRKGFMNDCNPYTNDTIAEYSQRVLAHFKEHDFIFVEYDAKTYATSPHQIMFNPRTKKLKRVIDHIDQFSHFENP